MATFDKSSKESSQISLSLLLTSEEYYNDEYEVYEYRLLPSSSNYETWNASWKVSVSWVDNNAHVTIYCRRKLSSDTVQAVYSNNDNGRRHTQGIFKQGDTIFSGPTLETTATIDLNVDNKIWANIWSYKDTYIHVHITSLGPSAEEISVKIYEDAFSTVDKAQLFSESSSFQSDCVILLKDEKKVNVNKNLLSFQSNWWKDTFDKYNERVPLLSVDYEQFLDFLSVIYPTGHPITVKNVETLSNFAHDFKMTELLKRCDIYLMANTAKFEKSKLLLLAQDYNLERLQTQCISEYKKLEDIKAIKTEPEYAHLNDRTKRMLLDNILGISPSALSEAPVPENSASNDLVFDGTRASQILAKLASLSTCRSDIVLVVENAKIPAHKHYLSYFSKYFDNMFNGVYKESRENELTLEEVRYEEMVELLSVTYPANYAINETNIAAIVKLADYFKMPIILDRCKQELKISTKIKGALKLWLAQQYNSVSDLQFFNNIFNGVYKESRENELTLEEVSYEEMVELLSVTYPANYAINETNIAAIVKLADYFKMPIILDRCKQELKISTKIKGALKLWLAQQYNSVSDLQESRENELTLEEVSYEEMVELLSVTYPANYAKTDEFRIRILLIFVL